MTSRTLVAGVGYSHLSDLSVGPVLVDRFTREEWPAYVDIDDLSYGPVAVVQTLEDATPPYDRAVFIAAVDRVRPPGTVCCYRWDRILPGADDVQARVAEAVTGVVSLDNLLVVARQFGALPAAVFVIEVQPANLDFGVTFSDAIEARLTEIARLVRALVEEPDVAARCPVASLGGFVPALLNV